MASEAPNPQTSVSAEADLVAFKQDMKQLLRGALNLPDGRTGHVMKYAYSSVIPPGHSDSGADLYDRMMMLDTNYYIPMAEAFLVDCNRDYTRKLFQERPTVIDLGPGGYQALCLKSLPTLKMVQAKTYIAFDINESFASNAASVVRRSRIPGLSADFVHGDFTKPHKLEVDSPILMTMYGCTLSQYPLLDGGKTGEVTLTETLRNLGEMVEHKAIMFAAIDTNKHDISARNCYRGPHTDEFMRHFWLTAKTLVESSADSDKNYVSVIGDRLADPATAVIYDPRFENGGVTHTFYTKRHMTFVIDGERFEIPAGTHIDAGFSAKWSAEDIKKQVRLAGWEIVKELTDGQSTIRHLVLAGKNVSDEQKLRASGKASNGQSRQQLVALAPASAPSGTTQNKIISPFGKLDAA